MAERTVSSHFYNIPQDKAPEVLNLIVEIQKGDINKYEYNKEYGVLELDRVLYGPTVYPVNYCDVPNTWNAGDEDPLDAALHQLGDVGLGQRHAFGAQDDVIGQHHGARKHHAGLDLRDEEALFVARGEKHGGWALGAGAGGCVVPLYRQ